jgi:hypothetical protein
MNPYLRSIRAMALHYAAYKLWVCGNPKIRGWELHRAMADIQCYAAIYRVKRLKELRPLGIY